MTPHDVVKKLIPDLSAPKKSIGRAFAPSNIALIKYWGKRDGVLNLPMTSSLSISLGELGTQTTIKIIDEANDKVALNGVTLDSKSDFTKRLIAYLDLFRPSAQLKFSIETKNTVPTGAGVASSASGFAALVLALNDLFDWHLSLRDLSILARMGSGSACRSLWQGLVKWHRGEREDGLDSFAEKIPVQWPQLRVGLCLVSGEAKKISSREAMNVTTQTSPDYAAWPSRVLADLKAIEQAIDQKDFERLGQIAEGNAKALHQIMLTATPSIDYAFSETKALIAQVQILRQEGLPVYFTQDAGPNIKLLFLAEHENFLKQAFLNLQVIDPWQKKS